MQNIEYAQADLLALGSLGRTFDVIEATGSLQALAAPMTGWRVLLSLLRPGGLMKIGLYSELARAMSWRRGAHRGALLSAAAPMTSGGAGRSF